MFGLSSSFTFFAVVLEGVEEDAGTGLRCRTSAMFEFGRKIFSCGRELGEVKSEKDIEKRTDVSG